MGCYKTKFLIILTIFNFLSLLPATDFKDVCGSWAKLWNEDKCVYESLSIQKIDEARYFVNYLTFYGDHTLDFAGIAFAYDENKLIYQYKLNDGTYDNFFIYFDFDMDYAYVLWNHEIPDFEYYDIRLERVTKLYDEKHQNQSEKENQDKLNEAIIEWVKNP